MSWINLLKEIELLLWVLGKSKFVSLLGQKKLDQLNKDFKITTKKKGDFPEVV
jgi:hypothetical protein